MLQFAPRVCWPLDTGAKLRNYHLGQVLSEHAAVSLLAFIHEGESSSLPENFYQQITTVKRDQAYSFTNLLRGAVSSTPLPLLNYTTGPMLQALERVLAETPVDIVQMESIHLMGYLPIIMAMEPRPLIICDWHNIESELMSRYSDREGQFMRRAYARRTVKLMRNFEQRALMEFDAHITVSERDAARLRSLDSKAQIFVVENGVDADHYSDKKIEEARRLSTEGATRITNRIVFVGSMDYHANIDGVVSFSREIWPKLHARKPELIFTIVGRDPSAEVRELASIPGIEVTGTVDDVRPYYGEAVAAIVPLKVGGGSRLKILEAMAAGVPVISTSLGAEGLEVDNGQNILIADSDDEMIETVVGLSENQEQKTRLRHAGRTLVSSHYDWSRVGANLFEIYQKLIAK